MKLMPKGVLFSFLFRDTAQQSERMLADMADQMQLQSCDLAHSFIWSPLLLCKTRHSSLSACWQGDQFNLDAAATVWFGTQPHLVCCVAVQDKAWAAQYNTWLLIKLMPKGVVFSGLAVQDKAQQSERMLAEMAAQMQQLQ